MSMRNATKRCSVCKKLGHNARTCGRDISNGKLPTVNKHTHQQHSCKKVSRVSPSNIDVVESDLRKPATFEEMFNKVNTETEASGGILPRVEGEAHLCDSVYMNDDTYTENELITLWNIMENETPLTDDNKDVIRGSGRWAGRRFLTVEARGYSDALENFIISQKHSNFSAELWGKFLKRFGPEIRERLTNAKTLPQEVCVALLNDRSSSVRVKMLAHPDTPMAEVDSKLHQLIAAKPTMNTLLLLKGVSSRKDLTPDSAEKIYNHLAEVAERSKHNREIGFRKSGKMKDVVKENVLTHSTYLNLVSCENTPVDVFEKIVTSPSLRNVDVELAHKVSKGEVALSPEKLKILATFNFATAAVLASKGYEHLTILEKNQLLSASKVLENLGMPSPLKR